jgi:hypothetical protein
MIVLFFFGPDKIPYSVKDNGIVESNTTMPFHGIIGRGLLNKFIEQNLSTELWHQVAFKLFDDNLTQQNAAFKTIQNYATECSVLSFGQSSLCTQHYVLKYCKDENIEDAQIELWNVKEGHTASVWKVTIKYKEKIEVFAINVARDNEAGRELKNSSEIMKTIGNKFPEINIAKVHDLYLLQDEVLLSANVVIVRNDWIANSYEIHSRKNKQTGTEELLMVDRFLTQENNPAHIISVLGRVFTTSEVQKIETDLNDFLTKAATCFTNSPTVNINDGDVVWDGQKAIIVAVS